jgi:hypothetical protein
MERRELGTHVIGTCRNIMFDQSAGHLLQAGKMKMIFLVFSNETLPNLFLESTEDQKYKRNKVE